MNKHQGCYKKVFLEKLLIHRFCVEITLFGKVEDIL